jgi:protein-S-isoprenylcysteine O-methyltransferase Ste14
VRKGHQVIKQGVYGSIRHPVYAAISLFSLAQGLLLENWIAGWAALVSFSILVLVRMPREEAMMSEFFGQEYRRYIQQTGRLLPGLRGPR